MRLMKKITKAVAVFLGVCCVASTVSAAGISENLTYLERETSTLDDKYRTYYEVFVYSFYDSDGDGIGDLKGVEENLDYLNDGNPDTDTDLGVTGIWLMPIMPSTTYHKYDITDYMDIDPEYGSLADFDSLIEACHARGIRVIIDLPMNHTSSQHPWFQEAAGFLAEQQGETLNTMDTTSCPYVDYYHFTDEAGSGYTQLGETQWHYESQFWSEMPDLDLTNEAVRQEFESVADFWMEHGVDGFRLDAVKEFVSGNAEVNTEILSWFAEYVHGKDSEQYIVCECWTDQNTYAKYYASEVDSMFDFAFAGPEGIIRMVVNGQKRAYTYAKRQEAAENLYASYYDNYINAPFYTNHDMARSAGYYSGEYQEEKVKIAQALNLLMSGNVFLYYGEELGMKGSGIDENKRAPMYWSTDSEAEGMCDGPKDMEPVEMKYGSLEEQRQDGNSIYQYVKKAIQLRNENPEIARGETTYLEDYSGDDVFALARTYEGSTVYLLGNLSEEPQEVEISNLLTSGFAVAGELYTGTETAELQDGTLILPAYSILAVMESVEMR